MNYRDFDKNLKENKIAPVYLFSGSERYLIKNSIERIKELSLSDMSIGMNYTVFDSRSTEVKDILDLAETVPVFSDKRMIIIDSDYNLLGITDTKVVSRLNEYLKNPSDTTVLIIIEEKPDKRKKIYKALKKDAELVEFNKPERSDTINWIIRELKERRVKITKRDAGYLLDRLYYDENEQVDLYTVLSCLENLTGFVGKNGTVTRKIIDKVVPESIEDNVFKLIDLVVRGELKGMFTLLDYFWEEGQDPISLLGLLVYQLRNLTKVKMLEEMKVNPYKIPERAGINAYVVKKLNSALKRFSLEELFILMQEAAELDEKMKMGQIELQFGLENFLLKMGRK